VRSATSIRSLTVASAFFALAIALAGSAHKGGHDVRGVVKGVSAQELTVETSKGVERFVLTPQTVFVRNGSPASAEDLKQSDRVVVHAKLNAGRLEAIEVQFAAPKKR
jgi:hypothetical protein